MLSFSFSAAYFSSELLPADGAYIGLGITETVDLEDRKLCTSVRGSGIWALSAMAGPCVTPRRAR